MFRSPQKSPLVRHSPHSVSFYGILFLLLTVINSLAAKFAVLSFEVAPGVSSFYIAVALMTVFALWFGMWGATAAYAGCFVGAGIFGGIPPGVNLFWSLADFWQVLIPLLAFRIYGADVSLRGAKDLLVLVVFGIFLNNLAGAIWGPFTLALAGIISWTNFVPVFFSWLAGNIVVSIILVPLLLYLLTPAIRSRGLIITNFWQ